MERLKGEKRIVIKNIERLQFIPAIAIPRSEKINFN